MIITAWPVGPSAGAIATGAVGVKRCKYALGIAIMHPDKHLIVGVNAYSLYADGAVEPIA